MAQAAVALPETKKSASPAPQSANSVNVDELLSQLAGEEIDRLLADAENGRSAEPPAPRTTSEPIVSPTATAPSVIAAPTTAEVTDTTNASANDAPKHAAVAPAADDPFSAQLDDLFNQLESQTIAVPDAAPEKVEKPAAPAVIAAAIEPVAAAEAVTSHAVASAAQLVESHAPPADVHTVESDHDTHNAAAERIALELDAPVKSMLAAPFEPRPSLLIRFLELLNAPMNSCPQSVRSTIGKLALMTLFNAIAVLVYVVAFRKHH